MPQCFSSFRWQEISATPECRYSRVVIIIIGACQLEQSWNVFGSGAQTRIRKNKHICVVTCPTPLIVFNWSTIRLRSGPPLENIVWIITVYRASNPPHPHPHPPPFSGICYLQSQLHGTKCTQYPPSAHPVMHSFISFPLILWDPAEGLTCYQHGCCTGLAAQETKKQQHKTKPTLSVPGRGCAAPMCHAICTDWLTLAFSSTCVCLRELQSCLGRRAKVCAAHWTSAEDNAPILPLPLWNKPIISPIVCSQL